MESDRRNLIINYFLENDVLIPAEFSDILQNERNERILYTLVKSNLSVDVIETHLQKMLSATVQAKEQTEAPNSTEVLPSKEETDAPSFDPPKSTLFSEHPLPPLTILRDYDLPSQKREVADFVSYFSIRYKKIEQILRARKELSSILSIARLKGKKDRDTVSIIGLIKSKEYTKNNNIILTLEDQSDEIKVLINKSNQEIFEIGKDLVEDEVIGVVGVTGDNILFSNTVIQPDIPLDKEMKKYHKDDHVIFLSDIHFGSKDFLEKEFDAFLDWITLKKGSAAQQELASKVKYIVIVGDLIDGVGIYPGQEDELTHLDAKAQYDGVAEKLRRIPKHIRIITCPGNHDAVRLAEPQPKFPTKYAQALYDIENLTIISNPGMVTICEDQHFPGFDILLYHGYSFDYYAANVDSIRLNGGYDRGDLIMKFLLKRRHLAPTYKSTLLVPDPHNDALVIDHVPDFFVTGHIHKTAASTYRNVTLLCGSCWQAKTAFQEKVGHHPEPARVPLVNLKTRKVTVLNFEQPEEEQATDSEGEQKTEVSA